MIVVYMCHVHTVTSTYTCSQAPSRRLDMPRMRICQFWLAQKVQVVQHARASWRRSAAQQQQVRCVCIEARRTASSRDDAYQRKEGDWVCSSCNFDNFAYRKQCNRCGEPRGDAPRGGRFSDAPRDSKPYVNRPGDWLCSCNTVNFAFRATCFSCRAPREDALEVY